MVVVGYFLIHWKFQQSVHHALICMIKRQLIYPLPKVCFISRNLYFLFRLCIIWELLVLPFSTLVECSEEMVLNMSKEFEISPSLREIVNHFDDDKRHPDAFSSGTKQVEQVDKPSNSGLDLSDDTFENGGTWDVDHDDQNNVAEKSTYGGDQIISSHYNVLVFLSLIHFLFIISKHNLSQFLK